MSLLLFGPKRKHELSFCFCMYQIWCFSSLQQNLLTTAAKSLENKVNFAVMHTLYEIKCYHFISMCMSTPVSLPSHCRTVNIVALSCHSTAQLGILRNSTEFTTYTLKIGNLSRKKVDIIKFHYRFKNCFPLPVRLFQMCFLFPIKNSQLQWNPKFTLTNQVNRQIKKGR